MTALLIILRVYAEAELLATNGAASYSGALSARVLTESCHKTMLSAQCLA